MLSHVWQHPCLRLPTLLCRTTWRTWRRGRARGWTSWAAAAPPRCATSSSCGAPTAPTPRTASCSSRRCRRCGAGGGARAAGAAAAAGARSDGRAGTWAGGCLARPVLLVPPSRTHPRPHTPNHPPAGPAPGHVHLGEPKSPSPELLAPRLPHPPPPPQALRLVMHLGEPLPESRPSFEFPLGATLAFFALTFGLMCYTNGVGASTGGWVGCGWACCRVDVCGAGRRCGRLA